MIELFTADTPNGKKISIMLEEIKYDYKITKVNISKDEQFTTEFKKIISDETLDLNKSIKDLNIKISNESSYTEKEILFKEVELFEIELTNKKAEILDNLLPQAFAVIKETAKRFFENNEIEVTASDFDKEIASKKSYTTIKSDKSIWKNNWDAAGKNVVWDMIHYDVQLIGGIVLHQGRIGEMQTGR